MARVIREDKEDTRRLIADIFRSLFLHGLERSDNRC